MVSIASATLCGFSDSAFAMELPSGCERINRELRRSRFPACRVVMLDVFLAADRSADHCPQQIPAVGHQGEIQMNDDDGDDGHRRHAMDDIDDAPGVA